MAPPPTAIKVTDQNGQITTIPAGDVYHDASGAFTVQQNGQYYSLNSAGQLSPQPVPAPANLTASYPGSPSASGSNMSNSTVNYSSLLPTASQLESYAPLSYQDFGAVPQYAAATVNPATIQSTPQMQAAQQANVAGPQAAQQGTVAGPQAASVDNAQLPGALSQYEQLNSQALAPQFKQQNDALTGSLAQRGIFNSSAGQELQNNLSGQQDAALAQANSPLVQQFAGAYNSNNQLNASNQQASNLADYQGLLSQATNNAANQQSANLAGYQGLLSQATNNAANQQAANSANYQGLLGQNSQQAQLQQNAGLANQDAYNQANAYNASSYGTVTGANMKNYNDYLQLLQGQNNTLTNGLVQGTLASYDPQATGASSLLNQGLNNASNAYSNAYNNGAAGTANLASTFGQLGSSLVSSIGNNNSNSGGADMSNSSFGDY
jgi:hypothetical protein